MTNYGELSSWTIQMCAKSLADALDKIMFDVMKQSVDPVDPALRIRQEAIRGEITSFSGLDGRWQPLMSERQKMLQAECALIGHRWVEQSSRPGVFLPVCLFCGMLDKP